METDHLKEFVYLAETLSFKETARHFYVNRSVISRHLAALEETLGVTLLDRSAYGVRLTPYGKLFYRDAQIILRDLDAAFAHMDDVKESHATIVRIGYVRNAARPVLADFILDMKRRYPDVHLSLVCMEYRELRRAMDEGTVDVALSVNVNPEISHNYRSTFIYSDRFYAVMSKSHPLAKCESISIDDPPDEGLLLPDSFVYSGFSELIDTIVEEQSRIVAREYYRDIDMLYLKVQTENLVALSSGMNNVMFGDSLAVVPVSGADMSFSVSAFYHDDFDGIGYEACCDGFEACRKRMKNRQAEGTSSESLGFSVGSF